jgi:hypothetical protein
METMAYLHHATALESQELQEQGYVQAVNTRWAISFLATAFFMLPIVVSSTFVEKAHASAYDRVLRYGDAGGLVRTLQFYLAKQELFDRQMITGNFLEITRDSVMEFQRRNGLVDDGVVGEMTWAALIGNRNSAQPEDCLPFTDSPRDLNLSARCAYRTMSVKLIRSDDPTTIMPNTESTIVGFLQHVLSGLPDPYLDRFETISYVKAGQIESLDQHLDNYKEYGETTQDAIVQVQRDCNLPESGIVDSYTKACLEEMVFSSR